MYTSTKSHKYKSYIPVIMILHSFCMILVPEKNTKFNGAYEVAMICFHILSSLKSRALLFPDHIGYKRKPQDKSPFESMT